MPDPKQELIERFPEKRDVIKLLDADPRFDALCDEYLSVSRRLAELMKDASPNSLARIDILQAWRVAIEEELVTAIEGYRPN